MTSSSRFQTASAEIAVSIYGEWSFWWTVLGIVGIAAVFVNLFEHMFNIPLLPLYANAVEYYRYTARLLIGWCYFFLPFEIPNWGKDLIAFSIASCAINYRANKASWRFDRTVPRGGTVNLREGVLNTIWYVSEAPLERLSMWIAQRFYFATGQLAIARFTHDILWVLGRGLLLFGAVLPLVAFQNILRSSGRNDATATALRRHAVWYFGFLLVSTVLVVAFFVFGTWQFEALP